MATVMHQHQSHVHPPRPESRKNTTQTISLMVGFVLFIVCLCGLLFPAFGGLHLSILHSLIIGTAGVTLFYNGYKVYSRGAYRACLGFGIFFALHALIGFIFGKPGVPNVGFRRPDSALLEIIPNFSELGTTDHVFNAVLGVILLAGAYDWHRRRTNRSTILG